MKQYIELLNHVLIEGDTRSNRTQINTKSVFGYQMGFDLSNGFPLITTKKMFLKGIIAELLWFIEGATDERRLAEIQYDDKRENLIDKKTIWTDNADNQGKSLGYKNTDLIKELGPIYGKQWRDWNGFDQLLNVVEQIKNNPESRRIILSAWNVDDIDKMALPPCHTLFHFYVNKGKLSCQLYQRSADVFLGVPFNIASYALLTMMIAQVCDLKIGHFIHTLGDAHIYSNHYDQVKTQLKRNPYHLPTMKINPEIKDIDDFKMSDFELQNYEYHPIIKGDMAI